MVLALDFNHGAESARQERKLARDADRHTRLRYRCNSVRYCNRRKKPPDRHNIGRNSIDLRWQQMFFRDRITILNLYIDVKTDCSLGLLLSVLDSRPYADADHVVMRVRQPPVTRLNQKSLYRPSFCTTQIRHRAPLLYLTIYDIDANGHKVL